ncbi:MAG: trypsin-like peptidase domain-containing protein [Agathobacter sp.]|nr:trypsin-like peptidase domain-containing protein [Agathobacter sp.]
MDNNNYLNNNNDNNNINNNNINNNPYSGFNPYLQAAPQGADMSQQPVQDMSQQPAQDMSQQPAQDMSQKSAQDISQQPAQDMSQQPVQNMSQKSAQNMGQQPAQNINYAGNAYGSAPVNRAPANSHSANPPKKKSGFGAFIGKVAVAAVVFGLIGGSIFVGIGYAGSKTLISKQTSNTETTTSGKKTEIEVNNSDENVSKTATGNAAELTDISQIVDEVMPSIVSITNTANISYEDFWGRNENRQSQSCGSGFIISKDDKYLYIASNNHVVAQADSLKVQFSDGESVEGKVRGTDPSDDLAVVMVALDDMPEATLNTIKIATIGDSNAIKVGNASIAIGNALGYGQSVTTGVISALNRSVSTQDETTGEIITNSNLIQTDAAINPGNSGGALLNANGEVIGINSVKYASTEVEGIGYAIPMAYAKPILESLIENGEYVDTQTAYLGIRGGDVPEDMVAYGYPEGVLVSEVLAGAGAGKAGIQERDIITEIEGKKISSMAEFQAELKNYSAGDTVEIKIARQDGSSFKEKKVKVKLSSASDIKN